MQMIRVVDSIACSEASLECDPWIPMKVTWEPRPLETPLYLRISGSNGGEVEVKVDPTTGMLVQVVVIEEPRQVSGTGPLPTEPKTQQHSPVIERTPWGLGHGSDGVNHSVSAVSAIEDIGFVRTADHIELVFVDQKPARYVCCGNVAVAVSDQGGMAAIRALL
ncbi:hypothetical protein [Streptomyces silvisoli]|uniref:Uncharacterized protein n=1 Tax=Streptomyces silvisoli TaxID=3034235 RepID=A0ABT5ZHK8_9ACTN|nr:hypothetical protein [Streptomyces silvisoli]MDF3289308.1 hypothetical protein [Streptomyces silvisoli]